MGYQGYSLRQVRVDSQAFQRTRIIIGGIPENWISSALRRNNGRPSRHDRTIGLIAFRRTDSGFPLAHELVADRGIEIGVRIRVRLAEPLVPDWVASSPRRHPAFRPASRRSVPYSSPRVGVAVSSWYHESSVFLTPAFCDEASAWSRV